MRRPMWWPSRGEIDDCVYAHITRHGSYSVQLSKLTGWSLARVRRSLRRLERAGRAVPIWERPEAPVWYPVREEEER